VSATWWCCGAECDVFEVAEPMLHVDVPRAGPRAGRAAGRRASIALFTLLLGACDGELPRFGTLQYEGDDFEVWASDGLSACEGTHAYTEAWLSGFRERMGPHAKPQHHVFNWVDDEDLVDVPCSTLGACAASQENVIYSTRVPHEHEIVHVELDMQNAPPVLSEGAAEAFGTDQSPIELTHDVVEQLLAEIGTIPLERYPAAGRFTRYLIDTYGLDAWIEIVRASPEEAARFGIERAFLDVLGERVTDVLADFETSPACSTAQWRYYDYECGAHPLTDWVDASRWEASVDLSCDDEAAIGPQDDAFWTVQAFEIEEPGTYELTGHASEGATFELVPCARSCFTDAEGSSEIPPHLGTAWHDLDAFPLELQAGRYWFRIEQSVNERATVSLSLQRALKR
jgi:hypothetical protein